MLKWAVNKPLTASPVMSIFCDDNHTAKQGPSPLSRRSLGAIQNPAARHQPPHNDRRRKSFGSNAAILRHQRRQNKENHIMVTPHPITMRLHSPANSSPFSKADVAFREIGNLTPTTGDASFNTTPVRKRNLPLSPMKTGTALPPVKPFAPTLPTMDVEYSPAPCAPKPVSFIPLRGITIANTFFGNARYFSDDQLPTYKKLKVEETPLAQRMVDLRFGGVNMQTPSVFNNNMEEEDELNMSSKALDDKALDQMIDEILQSTRKTRKLPMAVTRSCVETIQEVGQHQEREVRTPECTLRRQRGVRRKIKPTDTTSISPDCHHDLASSQIEILASMNTPKELRTAAVPNVIIGQHNNSIISKNSCDSTPGIAEQDVQGSSTPTGNQAGIRRCLRFPDSPDSMEDSLEKRKSVASSTASSSSRCSKSGSVTGLLDIGVGCCQETGKIKVHGELLVKINKKKTSSTKIILSK